MEKQAIAKLNRLRIAPRKVRLVANLIRGQKTDKALAMLRFTSKKAAKPFYKLLTSALANAKNNSDLNLKELYIKKVTVDQGPTLKRFRPRAMGRANEIRKKTSHITIFLAEKQESRIKNHKSKIKN
jgi:large subunit ribosomal protein L22